MNNLIYYINFSDGDSIKIELHNPYILTKEEVIEYDKLHAHEDWEDE